MSTKTIVRSLLLLGAVSLVAPDLHAYCLTGVRWPDNNNPAPMYYNPSGKITTGQCISASAMDSAVTSGITPWSALRYAGTTTRAANKRDGQNTVGWGNLGGQTLGITNYLDNDSIVSVSCGGVTFANLYEADVRLTTTFRWTASGGGCPCAAGSGFYLNAVSEHEFGHVIGLCHVNQQSQLMYPSFGVCENKNKGSDDQAGENAICY